MRKLKSRGAAAVEYGTLIGLVALASIAAVYSTGETVEEAICTPASELAEKMGGEKDPRCIFDPHDKITLKDGERFVDAPTTLLDGFEDVVFASDEIGDRVVLAKISEAPTESFWLDTSILSKDAYEPSRNIASCYALEEGLMPICTSMGQSSALTVPPQARAYGYMVTLNERTDMPLGNDVAISVPETGSMAAQSWAIDVSREAPAPVVEDVAFTFTTPYLYERSDAGWTFGEFVDLEGTINQPITMSMRDISGPDRNRRACYRMSETSEAKCGSTTVEQYTAQVTVPAGAAQIGYEIDLPDVDIGADWSVGENFHLQYGSTYLFDTDVTIIRPNEPEQYGEVAGVFGDFLFKQTDSGWTEGEFLALTGERNVIFQLVVSGEEGDAERKACYKIAGDDTPKCGDPADSDEVFNDATVYVPTNAISIGYMINLPAEGFGDDWVHNDRIYARNLMNTVDIQLTRPNEPRTYGAVTATFSDVTFKQTDAGWIEAQFIPITGERNTYSRLTLRGEEGSVERQACYKTEAGGVPTCGDPKKASDYDNEAWVNIPVTAVEVGYMVQLPNEDIGPDWTHTEVMDIANGLMYRTEVSLVRPNEPYAYGSVTGSFGDVTFAQTDTGWIEAQFIPITGERNTHSRLTLRGEEGSVERMACYKTEAGGEPTCGDPKRADRSDNQAWVNIPVSAVEVGYMVQLPNEDIGPDWTHTEVMDIANGLMYRTEVSLVRPNEPKAYGGVTGSFSDTFTFAQTDTGWTEAEFIPVTGERNVDVRFYARGEDGYHYKKACYKNEVGGDPICGDMKKSSNSDHDAYVDYPPSAVEVGYMIQLPAEAIGTDWSYTESLQFSPALMPQTEVTLVRPNEPKAYGGVTGSFSDTFTFAQTDTGWTEAEFIPVTGERNVNVRFYARGEDGYHFKKACYKNEVGGDPICGDMKKSSNSDHDAYVDYPPSAVEVGYMIQLPAEAIGSDWSYTESLQFSPALIPQAEVTLVRPNEPRTYGELADTFRDITFSTSDTGWTEGQFVDLVGNRNVEITVKLYGPRDWHERRACYKLEGDPIPKCGDIENSYYNEDATVKVPLNAVSVGYMVNITGSSTWTQTETIYVANHTGQSISLTRPQ